MIGAYYYQSKINWEEKKHKKIKRIWENDVLIGTKESKIGGSRWLVKKLQLLAGKKNFRMTKDSFMNY